jgi:hypothetical protein
MIGPNCLELLGVVRLKNKGGMEMSVVQKLEHLILAIPPYLEEIAQEEALHKTNRES